MAHIAIVSHDSAGRDASGWIKIRGSRLYWESVGIGRLLARNDSLSAACRLDCMPRGTREIPERV